MTGEAPILRISGVSMHYGGLRALHNVTLEAHAGEVLGLVGNNGAGKSTLLKILAGVQRPTSGEMAIAGARCVFDSPIDAVQAGISTVYQDLALAMQRNVVANFFIGRELTADSWLGRRLGWLDTDAMTRVTKEQLARLHTRIPDVQVMCKELSGGQRQALAIARAPPGVAGCCCSTSRPAHSASSSSTSPRARPARPCRRGGGHLRRHQIPDVMRVWSRVVVLRLGRSRPPEPRRPVRRQPRRLYHRRPHRRGGEGTDGE